MKELIVSKERFEMFHEKETITGIFVRAKYGGKWGSYDIAVLTKESLRDWLYERSVDYCKDVIGILLGHGNLSGKE